MSSEIKRFEEMAKSGNFLKTTTLIIFRYTFRQLGLCVYFIVIKIVVDGSQFSSVIFCNVYIRDILCIFWPTVVFTKLGNIVLLYLADVAL